MSALLELKNVGRNFGGLAALSDVSFDIHEGEILGLIGPNGAGKTTLINVITGVYPPSEGRIFFKGERIDKLKPHTTSRLGIARTFQVVQPFPGMTALDNVAAGALFAAKLPSIRKAKDAAQDHLRFVGLDDMAQKPASTLTLPNRKRLELAKSLAMQPKLLLLDEVMAGLNATEIDSALELINKILDRGITIMLIEHVMKVVMSVCTRVVVLHHGQLIRSGAPNEVVRDPRVIKAYLGKKFAQRQEKAT